MEQRSKVTLAVLVVVLLALSVVVWLWWGAPRQPDLDAGRVTAEKFLELVRSGQAPQAWASTTAEFKSAEGRESFVRSVKKQPALTQPLSFVSVQTVMIQNSPRAEYVFTSADGKNNLRILIGYDAGAWRVDRLTQQ